MCTVLLAFHAFDETPLYIAANRDERRDRPAESFALRSGKRRYLAPRDVRAGGTWIGVNDAGVVVAITNRYMSAPDPDRRSRGELVAMALEESSVDDALMRLEDQSPTDYNGFHLAIASRDRAQILWCDSRQFHTRGVEPGLHVLTERSFGAAESAREEWLASQLSRVAAPSDLDALLLYRAEEGFEGTLVDVPELNYGTRSSTLIGLGPEPQLRHADGPPGQHDYRDLSDELRDLLTS